MDVILGNDFAKTTPIYFCYAEHADGGGGRIAVASARLEDGGRTPRLVAVKAIFRQHGPASRGLNIGCRMAQASDGDLFVTLGDHFSAAEMAQTLDNHIGKIVRIRPDGSVPPDNPFVGKQGALPEIWAYGLRNPEGLAFNPADGKLWEQEHGPQRRRRDQHHREGQELRLAGGQLRRQLRRHAGRHRQARTRPA